MSSQNYISNEGPHGHGRIRSPIRRLVSFLADILAHCLLPTGTVPSAPTAIGGVTEDPVTRGHSVRVGEESGEEQGQRRCLQCPQRRRRMLISYHFGVISSNSD